MTKPLAKSLHTITVLVRVAKLHLSHRRLMGDGQAANAFAVGQALETLGLGDMPDTYGLVQAAIKQLSK